MLLLQQPYFLSAECTSCPGDFYAIGVLSYYTKNSLLTGCGLVEGVLLWLFSLCRLFPKQCLQDRLIVIVSVAVAFLEKILYLLGG